VVLLSEFSLEILIPTIRKNGSKLFFTYNPRLITDPIIKLKDEVKDKLHIHTNYLDNPFTPQAIIDEAEHLKQIDLDKYKHIYLGEFLSNDDNAVIKRSWITSAIDSHLKLNLDIKGSKTIGYDVADSGDDDNCMILKHGFYIQDLELWSAGDNEINKSATRVFNKAKEFDNASIIYDSIGVGAGSGSKFAELNRHYRQVKFTPFNAGSKVEYPNRKYNEILNKDYFANLKAQLWWKVADMFRHTHNAIIGEPYDKDMIISINGKIKDLDSLITELSTPLRDFDNAGRVKVESKKDLAKRGIKSPNRADAFVMCFYQKQGSNVLASVI